MVWINNGNAHLDEVSNWRTILATCIALPVVTTLVVALRGYVRGRLLRNLGADDYVIFCSAVSGVPQASENSLTKTSSRYSVSSMLDFALDSLNGALGCL